MAVLTWPEIIGSEIYPGLIMSHLTMYVMSDWAWQHQMNICWECINIWLNPDKYWYNSLVFGRSGCNYKNTIFNIFSWVDGFISSLDSVIRPISRVLTDKLTSVLALCRQAASHCLSQCWLSICQQATMSWWINTSTLKPYIKWASLSTFTLPKSQENPHSTQSMA